VNRFSPPEDIARMREAYRARRHDLWAAFVMTIFDHVSAVERRPQMHLLDIASATGQLSFRAVQAGFGRVTSSEIRKEQSAQESLLLKALRNSDYRQRIATVHDPVSADDPSYPDRYLADRPDVACSFGLLYHLANPFQHLVNLHAIARETAVVYTMTHAHPFAKRMWSLTIENPDWITKATSSISWTPHFAEVQRLCEEVGFRRVTRVYPELFLRSFPEMQGRASRWTDMKMAAEIAVHRTLGLRVGHMRNFDPDLIRRTNLNPNYVAYVCEK
jgi:hypothetical protein